MNTGEGHLCQAVERLAAEVPLVPSPCPTLADEHRSATVQPGTERLHTIVGHVPDLPTLAEAADRRRYLA